jgi:hypothetical protein
MPKPDSKDRNGISAKNKKYLVRKSAIVNSIASQRSETY